MEFIATKEMYDQALKLFNVEIKKAGKGCSVFVTDENGNSIRHPINDERILRRGRSFIRMKSKTLGQNTKQHLNPGQIGLGIEVLKSLVLKELMRPSKSV